MTTSNDDQASQPTHSPIEHDPRTVDTTTRCECRHKRADHRIPKGRQPGKCTRADCSCTQYVEGQASPPEPPADQTHCPTCLNPICHKCRHHAASHRAPSHPPGKYTNCQNKDCACLQYEPPPNPTTYQITFHTDEYRGDHSAETAIGIADKGGETVGELFERISQTTGRTIKPTDYVTIRVEVTDE